MRSKSDLRLFAVEPRRDWMPDWVALVYASQPRPRTRADCLSGGCNELRPCPWVSCRHHLALDITASGRVRVVWPQTRISDMPETCALDVADAGGVTLERVGQLLNLTRERVRQIEQAAIDKCRARFEAGFAAEDAGSLAPLGQSDLEILRQFLDEADRSFAFSELPVRGDNASLGQVLRACGAEKFLIQRDGKRLARWAKVPVLVRRYLSRTHGLRVHLCEAATELGISRKRVVTELRALGYQPRHDGPERYWEAAWD